MFQSPVPLSVPSRCFLCPRGGAALSFGPWGGEQNPAWGPVLVVKPFLQTCPLRLSPLGLGEGPACCGGASASSAELPWSAVTP